MTEAMSSGDRGQTLGMDIDDLDDDDEWIAYEGDRVRGVRVSSRS